MGRIRIVKNRSDIGAGTRGSDMGIDAIEIAAINAGNSFFTQHEFTDVATHNETVYNKVKNTFAKRIKHVVEQCERVSNAVQNTLKNDEFPLVLSGDHSSALGTISGIKAQFPQKRLGVVWIDAHADLHSPFTSPSGNVHGMPLAAALGEDNLEHQINEIEAPTKNSWAQLKNIGIKGSKINAEDLIFIGVRDTEEPEDALMESKKIRNYPVHEIRFRGLDKCLSEITETLSKCDMIYISFDVDSMDSDLVSKGTGTPVSKGFDPSECIEIINLILKTKKVVCLELTEVNPLLDNKGNKMAETAFEVLDAVAGNL
ncbi:MAG: arginase [Flavobacteriales bacterium]|nr:arginase [Flavobacteriales bacterium]